MILRMQKMDQKELMKLIPLSKGQNEEKYFDLFLEALNNKINGNKYEKGELPSSLANELEKFQAISAQLSWP
ncbi:predicted protein [Methanosarcina acetivorans C2A]|uniref:Uncharacterized protein n=3 Tax=Methanosarcina acetivorans TaxID=2214 RepID=Q8TR61_METAC|nr:predicted protein [Methanosarcina acetivorans C2A]